MTVAYQRAMKFVVTLRVGRLSNEVKSSGRVQVRQAIYSMITKA